MIYFLNNIFYVLVIVETDSLPLDYGISPLAVVKFSNFKALAKT
jgi:hypothetical protein